MSTPTASNSGQVAAEYWRHADQGHLVVQLCRTCGGRQMPPRGACRSCLATELSFVESAVTPVLHSYSFVHRAAHPDLASHVPYCVALVELDEGVLLEAWLVDLGETKPEVGRPLEVLFREVSGRVRPVFRIPAHPLHEHPGGPSS